MSKKSNDARHLVLTERQLHDLELIVNGGFAPLTGFLNQEDYESVVENSRLADGTLWPIPIVLDVASESDGSDLPKVGENILLRDAQGNDLATLAVESVFVPDKKKEALGVYGTLDEAHPGVDYLFNKTKSTYVGGTVFPTTPVQHADFTHLRKSPEDVKKIFKEKIKTSKNKNILAFQTRNPIHRAHYELVRRAAEKHDAHILIHPAVGPTKDGDIDYATRVRSYEKLLAKRIPEATLALLPIAMRMAGPREALWHAIVRKNHGVTHFIVGRDHAGPGKDSKGNSFYGPYEAQELAVKHADEIGITIIASPELSYDETTKAYIAADEVTPESKITSISGTEFRRLLRSGENIPEWFSFPEVIEELRISEINKSLQGKTPVEIIAWAVAHAASTPGGKAIVSTNFRPYEAAVLYAATQVQPDIPVLWVDHGYNQPATYQHAEALKKLFNLNIKAYIPRITAAHRDAIYGKLPTPKEEAALKEFSKIFKLEPFQRGIKELAPTVWITALRKVQNPNRSELDIVSLDENLGILKVNPFFHFTNGDMDDYLVANNLPNEWDYFDPAKADEKRECGLHASWGGEVLKGK
jgi:ATP sulfurylase